MLEFKYTTPRPPIDSKIQVTLENLDELVTYVNANTGTVATRVDDGIEWDYGMWPNSQHYRVEVSDWLYAFNPYSQVSFSSDEPLMDQQAVTSTDLTYLIQEA
jgi:hypothetical protein